MKSPRSGPTAVVAVSSTAVAILNFGGPFAGIVDHSRPIWIMLMVFAEMGLIGCAALQWFLYFKAYINFRIELRSKENVPPAI